jgi:DNA gyrase subunit B
MTTKKQTEATYSAADIKTLDQITHVRKRIGMYLGSNSSEGITVGLREGLDNSVDEVLGGHGDTVIIRFFDDNSAEVEDYGRGLPVDKNAAGVNGIILTVGTIGSGGKFSGKQISGGLNGVGISAMNAASARFDVTVYRDNKKYQLSFKEGKPGFFDKPDTPNAKFTPNTELKVSKDDRAAAEKKKHPTGTTIRMWPDYTVFLPDSRFIVDDIKARLKATCFLVPQMTGIVEDYREGKKPVVDTFHFNAGIADMIPTLTRHTLVTKPVHIITNSSFKEMTNVLQDNGQMKQQEVERPVDIDVVFAYTNQEETILNSYVNIIQTKQHGTHVDGMWRALSRVIVNHIKENKFLKAKEDAPTMEDVRDGFVGIISIKFPEPTFSGQAKEALQTQQITSLVSQTVGDQLKKWLGDKKNASQAKLLCQKVVEAKRIREAAKLQKDTARKKSQLESSASMPGKLVACSSNDPDLAELWVCEGDSALGGLKQARDSNRVAIYPLRGKPLNVYDTPMSKILGNQEWADIIQILGAGSGKTFDINQVKYKKFVILADGDPDGSHISALVLCGLWKLMPEYIKAGMVYIAMPPLFSITTTGKNKERYYALNEEERDKLTKKLKAAGKKWDKIQRHKGLGEYSPEILDEVVNDPNTRVLRQINARDIEAFEQSMELAFGKNANNRKDWIVEARDLVDEEDLDF